MPKQLRFKQSFRDGRAVQHNKGLVGTKAEAMESLGHQLLAGTGLALNKDGRRSRSDEPNEPAQLLHG